MSGDLLLAIDTATRTIALAAGRLDGRAVGTFSRETGHRHAERLLEGVDELLADVGGSLADVGAVVVGTGPGSFTGLRVGMASAKVIAYSRRIPIIGLSTAESLAWSAITAGADEVAVVLPAGAADLYVARVVRGADGARLSGVTELAPAGRALRDVVRDAVPIAVDVPPGIVDEAASERGRQAVAALPSAVLALGARELAGGRSDDVAALVPAYVALPRGVEKAAAEMQWSPDLR